MRVVPIDARCAGVILGVRGSEQGPLCWRGSVPVWSACAAGSPSVADRSAEQNVPADRCAREIVRFLTVFAARLRRLNSTVGPGYASRCLFRIDIFEWLDTQPATINVVVT